MNRVHWPIERIKKLRLIMVLGIAFTAGSFGTVAHGLGPTIITATTSNDTPGVVPGQSFIYTVTVKNVGVTRAENVSIVLSVPRLFVYANGAIPKRLQNIGTINPGQTFVQPIIFRVPSDMPLQLFTLSSVARADNAPATESLLLVSIQARSGRVLGASIFHPSPPLAPPVPSAVPEIVAIISVSILAGFISWYMMRPIIGPLRPKFFLQTEIEE